MSGFLSQSRTVCLVVFLGFRERFRHSNFAGYVWDVHMVSVGSKQMRKPKKDGWFEHGMNCAEYLELNFGSAPPKQKPAPAPLIFPIPTTWMGA